MSETVHVTFQYAIGQQVRWTESVRRWRVIERFYREGYASPVVRYRIQSANDTEQTMAYEPDLTPWEDDTP